MEREEFRKRLQEMIATLQTALTLDGHPPVPAPVPEMPVLRTYDLSKEDDQFLLLDDLDDDLSELLRDVKEARRGGD